MWIRYLIIKLLPILLSVKLTKCDKTFDYLILKKLNVTYNKFEQPKNDDENTNGTEVNIAVYLHIESLREITSETTLDFYLVQFWNDPRLLSRNDPLKVTGRVLPDNVWYPDTYFLLVRSLLYSPEEQYVVFRNNGSVEYNRKVRLKTPCSPDFLLFPFDVVTCSLVLSSFGYTSQEVTYKWQDGGVFIDEKNNGVDHLGFYLVGTSTEHFWLNYGESHYSALKTVVYLKRKYSAYLMQVYFPAALIVILSWSIFWINLKATPARASLGVTTVLTMLTLATESTSQNAKHVNGKVTAIDIYLWVCFVFVIFAMLEFASSDFTTHNEKPKSKTKKPPENSIPLQRLQSKSGDIDTNEKLLTMTSQNESQTTHSMAKVKKKQRRKEKQQLYPSDSNVINSTARILFPLCFLIFNTSYWVTLMCFILKNNSSMDANIMGQIN